MRDNRHKKDHKFSHLYGCFPKRSLCPFALINIEIGLQKVEKKFHIEVELPLLDPTLREMDQLLEPTEPESDIFTIPEEKESKIVSRKGITFQNLQKDFLKGLGTIQPCEDKSVATINCETG